MVDLVSMLYRVAKFLRVICAGYQVADAVANLSQMVSKMDKLEARVENLSEQLGVNVDGAKGDTTGQSSAGGI